MHGATVFSFCAVHLFNLHAVGNAIHFFEAGGRSRRFTPTCVGKMSSPPSMIGRYSVHSHVCGKNLRICNHNRIFLAQSYIQVY